MAKIVVILSGGVDSTVVLHEMKSKGHDGVALSFFYGQTHLKELICADKQAKILEVPHRTIDLSSAGRAFNSALVGSTPIPKIRDVLGDPQPVTYVPFRNLIFLSVAFGYAESIGAEFVAYGAQKHDMYGYWDTTPSFIQKLQSLASENRKNQITLLAPLAEMSKTEVVQHGLELGVDFSKTWSCYKGEDRICLTCPTCAERLKAFENLGKKDPLDWRVS